jgi:hypothetical protein
MSQPDLRVIGFLAEDARACFHALRVLVTGRPIPSRSRLFRVSTMSAAAPRLSTGATYPGFMPSSRRHLRASTSPRHCCRWRECVHSARDIPSPATFRPRVLKPLDGFLRALATRASRLATTSRACSCSRAWPPPTAGSPSSENRCPLAVARPTPDRPESIARMVRPRLRGFAPLVDSNEVRLPARPFIPSSGFVLLRARLRCRQ